MGYSAGEPATLGRRGQCGAKRSVFSTLGTHLHEQAERSGRGCAGIYLIQFPLVRDCLCSFMAPRTCRYRQSIMCLFPPLHLLRTLGLQGQSNTSKFRSRFLAEATVVDEGLRYARHGKLRLQLATNQQRCEAGAAIGETVEYIFLFHSYIFVPSLVVLPRATDRPRSPLGWRRKRRWLSQ